ncbi:MAG: nucleotidyltransferase domain-containing protein [Bryobacteraceae bacterium]|nr:nucleotidyltransferase domain-containing protein [Bryobacteraceae bacterium]
MPVRSLRSSVLEWPGAGRVLEAPKGWAVRAGRERPEFSRLACFGSYARGDWGVGSDLNLILLVREASEAFARRAACWDLASMPVPCDVLVYTPDEHARATLTRAIAREVQWI